jgi:hypothetical protein
MAYNKDFWHHSAPSLATRGADRGSPAAADLISADAVLQDARWSDITP